MPKKVLLPVMVSVAALVAVFGATAFACTNLATLNLSSSAGPKGTTVHVKGSFFRVAKVGEPSIVRLHWNSANGPQLAQAVPDAGGNVSMTATIPEAEAGDYVLIATQRTPAGLDEPGTPARVAFQLLGPGRESVVVPTLDEGSGSLAIAAPSAGTMALTSAPGVGGLVLLSTGANALVRRMRTRHRRGLREG